MRVEKPGKVKFPLIANNAEDVIKISELLTRKGFIWNNATPMRDWRLEFSNFPIYYRNKRDNEIVIQPY
jgi:hypothetical protein